MLIDPAFDEVIATIYQGPLEEEPWENFLSVLCKMMSAVSVTLVLNQPSEKGRGVLRVVGGNLESLARYQERLFAMDPFQSLRPGEVKSLMEMVPGEGWLDSELYKLCMKPAGLYDSLGVDIAGRPWRAFREL